MGIRFACHACGQPLNIKVELAGKRGVCPKCRVRFRIPREDSERSSPLETKPTIVAADALSGDGSPTGSSSRAAIENPANSDSRSPRVPDPAENPTTSDAETAPRTEPEPDTTNDPADAVPSAFQDPEAATWYVRPPSGGQYGPADTNVLKEWIDEGRVAATALLWRDGWPQWRSATDVLPELAERLPQGSGNRDSQTAHGVRDDVFRQDLTAEQSSRNASSGLVPAGSHLPTGAASLPTDLTGRDDIGAGRRNRSSSRILTISVLATCAVLLVLALAYAVTR